MPEQPYTGLATTFDTAAELYARVRPGYPGPLFVDLASLTGLSSADARVVEIGPGTGQATRGLLGRGWKVTAVEPGRELAAVARRELAGLGDVEVIVSPFEHWDSGQRSGYDLVFAATSWHWLHPSVAYRRGSRAAATRRPPRGRGDEHVLPDDGDDFFRQVGRAYQAVGMSERHDVPAPPSQIADPDVSAMAASGLFDAPAVRRYVWSQTYSMQGYLDLLSTYSGHIARPRSSGTSCSHRFGGSSRRRPRSRYEGTT
jgi:SAM-dependent methyltransferase